MKRIAMWALACALFLVTTTGCAWLCCDPCENACKPDTLPCNCNPCQNSK